MEKDLNVIEESNEMIDTHNKNIILRDISLENSIKLDLTSSSIAVDLGQTFTYTITIENQSDKKLFNLNINQRIEKQLRIFDVMVDSVKVASVDRYNKFINFYIDEIKPNEKKIIDIVVEVIDVKDKAVILSDVKLEGKYLMPKGSEQNVLVKSNIYEINIVSPKLILRKKTLVSEAVVGETVTFAILAENNGNLDIDNVVIRDILKPELKFLNGTVKIDGVNKKKDSILSGVNIGVLKKGTSKELSFQAKILCKSENGKVDNVSIAQYEYKIPGEDKERQGDTISNENSIIIQTASICVNKEADKKHISLGDEVTFSIDLINDGTLEAKNIIINEDINPIFEFIEGMFSIDGQIINNINLKNGVFVGDLKVGEKKNISYKVKYSNANNCNRVVNLTRLNFEYKQTNGLIFKGEEILKELEVNTNISSFKYITISDKVFKEKKRPPIEDVNNVIADINTLEYHLVKTIQGKSNEGQILTGYKIVVQGMIKEVFEYTSNEENKSIYTMCRYIPFSTFIVLPNNFKEGSKINIDYDIEDISFKKRDSECIYTNVCLLLIAKIQPYIDNNFYFYM